MPTCRPLPHPTVYPYHAEQFAQAQQYAQAQHCAAGQQLVAAHHQPVHPTLQSGGSQHSIHREYEHEYEQHDQLERHEKQHLEPHLQQQHRQQQQQNSQQHHPGQPQQPTTKTQLYALSQQYQHQHYDSVRGVKRARAADSWVEEYTPSTTKPPAEIIVIADTPPPGSEEQGDRPAWHVEDIHGNIIEQPLTKKRKVVDRAPQTLAHSQWSYQLAESGQSQARNTTASSSSNGGQTSTNGRATTATTAATSIETISSSSQLDLEGTPSQKRKRTTRHQANEKRRQAAAILDGCLKYQPPAKPIKKCSEVIPRIVDDPDRDPRVSYDDQEGHYIIEPNALLTPQYKLLEYLGQGTFGRVVKAYDYDNSQFVAIKIIRAVQKYRDASRVELRVLKTLRMNDPDNRNRCIHMRDCFDFRNHICIVTDLLDMSVFDFLKSNNFVPFPNSHIQSFARQLFTSIAYLHDLNLVHTDLKPENILLCSGAYQTFTYNRRIPSAYHDASRSAPKRKVLLDTEIRLIDFGSATFHDEYHSTVVSTRHYRAPEIMLGLGWSTPCDIWSIGCILVELFIGEALFHTHENLEHLAMIEAVSGRRIDSHLVHHVMHSRHGDNPAAAMFKRGKLDYPNNDTPRTSRKLVKAMKTLSEIIPENNSFLREFSNLLREIFVFDPRKRITAKQALEHPWFREGIFPDDGTEAAKIKFERDARMPASTRAALTDVV